MRDSRYVNVNVTAVCDEPAEITAEETVAARKTVVAWVATQDGFGAEEAAELMKILGIYPAQDDVRASTTSFPKLI